MSCMTPATFKELMYHRETAIHEQILEGVSKLDDVWTKDVVIANSAWTDGEGYLRETVRHHGGPNPQLDHSELWTTVEGAFNDNEVGPDDPYFDEAQANTNCALGPYQELEVGIENFTYRPKKSALKGPSICAEDVRTAWRFEELMNLHTKAYLNAVASHKSRWNRDTYIGLSRRYVAREGYSLLTPSVGALPVLPPSLDLLPMSVGLLDEKYPALHIEAAQWSAGRNAFGNPVFTVLMPPEDITQVMRDYYGSEVFLNQGVSKLAESYMEGINTPFTAGNWAFKADRFANRYKRNATTGAFERIRPWLDESANITGKKWRINPEWLSAPYAEAVVLMSSVFENKIFPTLATVGGGTDLGSAENGLIEWDGKPIWTSIPTECDPYGMTGNYRMHFKRAARILDCDQSYTIIYKRCPFSAPQRTCVHGPGCDTRESCEAPAATLACTADGNDLVIVSDTNLSLAVNDAVTVTVTGVGDVSGTVSDVDTDGIWTYTITLEGAASCGTGVTAVVKD